MQVREHVSCVTITVEIHAVHEMKLELLPRPNPFLTMLTFFHTSSNYGGADGIRIRNLFRDKEVS